MPIVTAESCSRLALPSPLLWTVSHQYTNQNKVASWQAFCHSKKRNQCKSHIVNSIAGQQETTPVSYASLTT